MSELDWLVIDAISTVFSDINIEIHESLTYSRAKFIYIYTALLLGISVQTYKTCNEKNFRL